MKRLVETGSLEKQRETKADHVPLTNCTVKGSISKIIDGILDQTVVEMRASAFFAFLFSESPRYIRAHIGIQTTVVQVVLKHFIGRACLGIQNDWDSGLCQSSGILENTTLRKLDVSSF
jgi:hypothetical protein